MSAVAVILQTESTTTERAVQYGNRLAEGLGEDLTIIPVYDESKYSGAVERKAMAGSEVTKLEDVRDKLSESTVQVVESTLTETTVPWTVDVFIGDLPSGLIEKIQEEDIDHLVVTTEQTSPTGKVIFGDLAQSLILNTSIPTTVLTEE